MLYVENLGYYCEVCEGEIEDDFTMRFANSLEDLILSEGLEMVVVFIVELIFGVGGVIVLFEGYYVKV